MKEHLPLRNPSTFDITAEVAVAINHGVISGSSKL